jgi:hypothetical protein
MSLSNLDFINIAHSIDNTRIYRMEGKFFCYTATITEIIPFSCLTVVEMAEHIMKMIESSWGDISLYLAYKQNSYNKRKMKKLNNLLKEGDVDISVESIKKWIVFLI